MQGKTLVLAITFLLFGASMGFADWCYQEYANVSTACGGLATGTYSTNNNWNDGDWSTFSNDGTGTIKYVNYSIPLGATNASLWQVRVEAVNNVTIPQTCWSYNSSKLMLAIFGNGTLPYYPTTRCYNGSDWTYMNVSFLNNLVYEEAMWWDIPSSIVSSCKYLNDENTTYNLTQNISTDVDTCIYFNATNQTLDCNGYTVVSTYNAGYGIYSAFNYSSVKNCIVNSTVFIGARLNGGHYFYANNSSFYAPSGTAFQIGSSTAGNFGVFENIYLRGWYGHTSGAHGTYTNVTSISTSSTYAGILISDQTSNNTFTNCSAISTASGAGLYFSRSANNTFKNGYIYGALATQGAVAIYDGSSGNIISNNTIDGAGNIGMTFWGIAAAGRQANNNIIANNTFRNSTTHLKFITQAGNNTFYLNNFSNTGLTPTYYINDSNGTNIYNFTVDSKSQGNIYANVIDGSIDIYGETNSSIPNLYIGNTSGPYDGFPYNSTNSQSKILGLATDYAPLTPRSSAIGNLTCRTLGSAGTTYNMTSSLTTTGTTCFTVTAANVTLDCKGFSITGDNTAATYAIYTNQFNTTIRNCNVSGYTIGIYLDGADNGTVDQINASATGTRYGLALASNAVNNTLANIWANSSGFTALLVQQSSYNNISNSVFISAASAAPTVSFDDGDYNTLSNVSSSGSKGGAGISLSSGSNNNNILYSSGASNTSYGVAIDSSSNCIVTNLSSSSNSGIGLFFKCVNCTLSNSTIISNTSVGLGLDYTRDSIIRDNEIKGKDNTNGAFAIYATSITFQYNNTIANNTVNGGQGLYAMTLAINSTIINNTFLNATKLLYLPAGASNNVICLNNFTNIGNSSLNDTLYYMQDLNGSNFFNCTFGGKNQGNRYGNVMNGSVIVAGDVASSITGLNIGTRGSGYPYNNSTSQGKLIGAIVDYAPLTYTSQLVPVMSSVEILNPSGGYTFAFSSVMRGWSSATDEDNNTLRYEYNWQLQGGANDSMNTSTTNFTQGVNVNAYNKSTFATRQVYTLYARAYDGSNYSDWIQSYPIIVTNAGYVSSGVLNASSNTVPVITMQTPANGSSTPSTSVQFIYNVTYHHTYTVELWVDGAMVDQRDYSLNQLNLSTDRTITTSLTSTTAPGTHTYYIKAKDITNATYQTSQTFTFTVLANASGFTGSYNISTGPQATVYGSPQRIWYDEFGTLYALYFFEQPAGNNSTLAITSINPTLGTPLQYYTITMNRTNDYFVALRYPNSTTRLVSYDGNISKQKSISFGLGSISVITNDTIFNISTNEYYDPYAYAYSLHHQTITYTASSLGLYWQPTYNDSYLMRQSIPSTTEASVNYTPISNLAWQTFANDSSLETWLYAYPENCTGNFTVKLYKYDGSDDSQTYFANPDTTCYSVSDIQNTKTMFETYNGTHYFIQNSPEATTVYQINGNKAVKITEAITSIGYFLFIDATTFVFYAKEGTTDYSFSCNFAGSGECIKNDATSYLSTMIYRGGIVSMSRNGTIEDVIKGQIAAGSSYTTLFYNLNRFDAKLACYDEILLTLLKGNFRIQSSTYGVAMTPGTEAWAFAITSAPFGNGIKQIYSYCQNGTSRQYFPTSINQTDTFSLNDTSPNAYYTFLIQDCFAQPVSNALVTAKRFLNDRQNWTIIEQAYSSVGGDAVLFLEPITTYQMNVLAPDGTSKDFVFIPSTTASTTIPIACASQTINVTPTVEHVYQNLSYRIMAKTTNDTIVTNGMTNQSFNISFNVSSPIGYIFWTNMQIWKTDGSGIRVNIYNETVNTSTGTYRSFFFNSTGGEAYYDMALEVNTIKSITNGTNMSSINESQRVTVTARAYVQLVPYNAVVKDIRININSAFCGASYDGKSACGGAWAWIFIATIITMLVVGYVSRFTLDGAGIIGAGVFMLLAIINPVVLGVAGILVPMWAIAGIVIIVTLMLIVWRYL